MLTITLALMTLEDSAIFRRIEKVIARKNFIKTLFIKEGEINVFYN